MRVISCANPKGGVGKTTIAAVLATTIASFEGDRPIRVKVIDADPAGNMGLWAEQRAKNGLPKLFDVIGGVTAETMVSTIDDLAKLGTTDFLIIDLEGTANEVTSFAIGRSDLTLIPLSPSGMDARLAAKASALVQRLSAAFRLDLSYAFAFCRTNAAIVTREHKNIMKQLVDNDQPMLEVDLKERAAFREMFGLGRTIPEMSETKSGQVAKATANAEAFTQAVIDFMVETTAARKAA